MHAVLKAIGTSLRIRDVFHHVSDARWSQNVEHELVGVVSYYGKHYTTFFFHTKLKVWVYFDDANVKEVRFRFFLLLENTFIHLLGKYSYIFFFIYLSIRLALIGKVLLKNVVAEDINLCFYCMQHHSQVQTFKIFNHCIWNNKCQHKLYVEQ